MMPVNVSEMMRQFPPFFFFFCQLFPVIRQELFSNPVSMFT